MTLLLRARTATLRALRDSDFEAWHEVRTRCGEWLTKWEPLPPEGFGDPNGRRLFISRCISREQEARLGSAYAFGVFVGSRFVGEANISAVQRGPVQSANIGYWVDMAEAGQGLIPQACAALFRFAFDELHLHRLQISIVPRNAPSLRVVEKLDLREEGLIERYIEINGVWENHRIFAITLEEWQLRRGFYTENFLS